MAEREKTKQILKIIPVITNSRWPLLWLDDTLLTRTLFLQKQKGTNLFILLHFIIPLIFSSTD